MATRGLAPYPIGKSLHLRVLLLGLVFGRVFALFRG